MCIFFRFIWIAFFFFFFYLSQVWSSLFLRCFGHFLHNSFVLFCDLQLFFIKPGLQRIVIPSWFSLVLSLVLLLSSTCKFYYSLVSGWRIWRKTAASTWWSERDLVYLPLLSAFKSNGMINERRCPCSPSLCNATCESLLLVFFQFNLFLIYFNSYVGYFFLT